MKESSGDNKQELVSDLEEKQVADDVKGDGDDKDQGVKPALGLGGNGQDLKSALNLSDKQDPVDQQNLSIVAAEARDQKGQDESVEIDTFLELGKGKDEDISFVQGPSEVSATFAQGQNSNISIVQDSFVNQALEEGFSQEEAIDDIDLDEESENQQKNPAIELQKKLMELKQELENISKLPTSQKIVQDDREILQDEGLAADQTKKYKAEVFPKAQKIAALSKEVNGLIGGAIPTFGPVPAEKTDSEELTSQLKGFVNGFVYNDRGKGSIESTIQAIENLQNEKGYEKFYIKDSEDLKSKVEALGERLKSGSAIDDETKKQASGIKFYLENEAKKEQGPEVFGLGEDNIPPMEEGDLNYEESKRNYIKNVLSTLIAGREPDKGSSQSLSKALITELKEKAKQKLVGAFIIEADVPPVKERPNQKLAEGLNVPSVEELAKAFDDSSGIQDQKEAISREDWDDIQRRLKELGAYLAEDFISKKESYKKGINQFLEEINKPVRDREQDPELTYENRELIQRNMMLNSVLDQQRRDMDALIQTLSIPEPPDPKTIEGQKKIAELEKLIKEKEKVIRSRELNIKNIKDENKELLSKNQGDVQANRSKDEKISKLELREVALKTIITNFERGRVRQMQQMQNQAPNQPAGGQRQNQPRQNQERSVVSQQQNQAPNQAPNQARQVVGQNQAAGGQNQAAGGQQQIQGPGVESAIQHMQREINRGKRAAKNPIKTIKERGEDAVERQVNYNEDLPILQIRGRGQQANPQANRGRVTQPLRGQGRDQSEKQSELEKLSAELKKGSIKQIKYQILTRAGMSTNKASDIAEGRGNLSAKAQRELQEQAEYIYRKSKVGGIDIKDDINQSAKDLMGQIAKGNLSKYNSDNSRDIGLLSKFANKYNGARSFDKKFEAALETQNDFRKGKTRLKSVGNFFKKRLTDFSGKSGTAKALLIPVVLVVVVGFPISIGGIVAGIIGGVVARQLIKREADIKKKGEGFNLDNVEKYKRLREKGIDEGIGAIKGEGLAGIKARMATLKEEIDKEKDGVEKGVYEVRGKRLSEIGDSQKAHGSESESERGGRIGSKNSYKSREADHLVRDHHELDYDIGDMNRSFDGSRRDSNSNPAPFTGKTFKEDDLGNELLSNSSQRNGSVLETGFKGMEKGYETDAIGNPNMEKIEKFIGRIDLIGKEDDKGRGQVRRQNHDASRRGGGGRST